MAQYELNLHDYWRIIRRRRWIILMTLIIILGSVTIFTNLQTPVYQATATVKVEPSLTIPGVSTDLSGWDMYMAINTEVKVIKSAVVAERTAKIMGVIDSETSEEEVKIIANSIKSKISARRIADTNLIEISALSSDAEDASATANATAEVYIEKGIEDRNSRARKLRIFIEIQLEDAEKKLKKTEISLKKHTERTGAKGIGGYLTTQLLSLNRKKGTLLEKYTEEHPQVRDINQQIGSIKKEMKTLPTEELEYSRLLRELRMNEELYKILSKRHKEAQISEADKVQSVFIVTPAMTPTAPIKPNRTVNMTVGAFLGLFLGFVLALLAENLDTSIGTIEDVEKFLELPVIGVIPHYELDSKEKSLVLKNSKRDQKSAFMRAKLIVHQDSKSPFVESYHTLRTNLKYSILKDSHKVIAFTSAGIGEGKTLTASNFALTAAQSGLKTLLVESDLRRPTLHTIFGVQKNVGLSDHIMGSKSLNEIIKTTTDFLLGNIGTDKFIGYSGVENFNLITCGTTVPNPIDLLNSPATSLAIKEMSKAFDLVILDCPPVLLFADALIAGAHVDGVIIVYQVGRMARRALKRTKDQLTNVNIPVIGVTLNNVTTSEIGTYYGYGYSYSYKYYSEK